MVAQHWNSVTEANEVGAVRRQVNQLAEAADFDEGARGRAAIIATELANNLARYAERGEIMLSVTPGAEIPWLDILAIDRGPGMSNVARCLEDGFSTGGTPGTGLGAVRRLATKFDIYSAQPTGTVVFARIAGRMQPPGASADFEWGVVCRPAPRETHCGDVWRIAERAGELSLMIADGLGHGPLAADAAEEGGAAFDADPFASLTEMLQSSDRRMRGTRGSAVAVARFAAVSGLVKYAGVGNIAGHLRGSTDQPGRGLVSHNGIVGVQIRKIQEFDYESPPRGVLVMHSDGLRSRWSFDSYPGLIHCHPAVIAAILYRDFVRGPDDLTVAVARVSQK